MDGERVIDVDDERAKLLAQILTNEKALAILRSIEDEAKSISEIAKELGYPVSTVSYHIDHLLKVGLVEVSGKKYGKKLQEVKLYRASNAPILLVPRKDVARVRRHLKSLDRLHVISLGVSGLAAAVVYEVAARVMRKKAATGSPSNAHATYEAPLREFYQVMSNTTQTKGSTGSLQPGALALAVLAFVLTLSAFYYLFLRKSPKRF